MRLAPSSDVRPLSECTLRSHDRPETLSDAELLRSLYALHVRKARKQRRQALRPFSSGAVASAEMTLRSANKMTFMHFATSANG